MLAALSVTFLTEQEISDLFDVGRVVSDFSERTRNFRLSDVGSVVSDFSQITENFSKFDVGCVVTFFKAQEILQVSCLKCSQ